MKFLKNLASKVNEAVSSARKIQKQFTEVAFLERAVAVGFLVGGADGDFDADERSGMIAMIKSDPTLGAFDDDQITTAFNKINDLYNITLPMGNRKSLELLSGNADQEQAKALMELGAVIATLNGSIDPEERDALAKIGGALNEKVADYEDLLVV